MLDHPAVDVALGLIVLYVVLSVAASSVKEWISSLFGLRSKNLRKGIDRLVGEDFARQIYEHPLIGHLALDGKKPSYIEAKTFARVVVDLLDRDGDEQSEDPAAIVKKLPENHLLRTALNALVRHGDGSLAGFQREMAGWFDESMTRVSGWYKRKAQLIVFGIAAAVTVVADASTFHIAQALWEDEALRASVAQTALELTESTDASQGEDELLSSFPLGWDWEEVRARSCLEWLGRAAGWIVTIAAVSLGAPFWFDLLGKVANLKGAGGKPGDQK